MLRVFVAYSCILHRVQALSVRHGLAIGPLVRALMYLLAPVAYPAARALDTLLGADAPCACTCKKAQLKSLRL